MINADQAPQLQRCEGNAGKLHKERSSMFLRNSRMALVSRNNASVPPHAEDSLEPRLAGSNANRPALSTAAFTTTLPAEDRRTAGPRNLFDYASTAKPTDVL